MHNRRIGVRERRCQPRCSKPRPLWRVCARLVVLRDAAAEFAWDGQPTAGARHRRSSSTAVRPASGRSSTNSGPAVSGRRTRCTNLLSRLLQAAAPALLHRAADAPGERRLRPVHGARHDGRSRRPCSAERRRQRRQSAQPHPRRAAPRAARRSTPSELASTPIDWTTRPTSPRRAADASTTRTRCARSARCKSTCGARREPARSIASTPGSAWWRSTGSPATRRDSSRSTRCRRTRRPRWRRSGRSTRTGSRSRRAAMCRRLILRKSRALLADCARANLAALGRAEASPLLTGPAADTPDGRVGDASTSWSPRRRSSTSSTTPATTGCAAGSATSILRRVQADRCCGRSRTGAAP